MLCPHIRTDMLLLLEWAIVKAGVLLDPQTMTQEPFLGAGWKNLWAGALNLTLNPKPKP